MRFEQLVAAALALVSVCSSTAGSAVGDRYAADGERATDPRVEAASAGARRFVPSDAERRKRGFASWSAAGSQDQFQGFDTSIWKPPVYQLSRPYYIPIYGAPGKTPVFYPPQPINLNPGFPPDNPIRNPFRGPPYLPPAMPTTEKPKNTTMKVKNRNEYDEDDERPIWGGDEVNKPSETVPTRPPRPPGLPEFPPLVHDVNMLSADDEDDGSFMPPATTPRPVQRPSTRRVPTTTTTRRPPAASLTPGPSNCVWAVVACCSGSSNVVSEYCFEQRGCPGPFWDRSPCESDFAKAAIAAALNYYN